MASKEIIINGVDVYKCGNAKRSIFGIDMECRLGCDCSQRPNCYFKQLARAKDKINYMEEGIKTVENARNDLERELKRKEQKLQEAMDNYVKLDNQRVKEYNELVDKYNNKEQECEELKEQLNQAKYLSEGALRLYSERQNIKYKQALDEIKKYQKRNCETCVYADTQNCNINCQVFVIFDIINKTKEQ